MIDCVVEQIDKFELLRVWEVSQFASPRAVLSMSLPQKQRAFGTQSMHDLTPEMRQPPQLCFEGKPIEYDQILAPLYNCSQLVGQFATAQGGYVVLISINADRGTFSGEAHLMPAASSWSAGAPFFGALNLFSAVYALYLTDDLTIENIVVFGHNLAVKAGSKVKQQQAGDYLFDSVERVSLARTGVTVDFRRGPSVLLRLGADLTTMKNGLRHRRRTSGNPWALRYLFRIRTEDWIYPQWLKGDGPIDIVTRPWNGIWRGMLQAISTGRSVDDLILIDPADGWGRYQGGNVAKELARQQSL